MFPYRTLRHALVGCLATLVLAPALPAQAVTDRSPNLSGGWTGEPGTIHFNLVHRLWTSGIGDDDKVVNSPTMILGVPVHPRALMGVNYATNSLVADGRFNEWELLARWAPRTEDEGPVGVALTGAWNSAAGSADGELSVSTSKGPVRLVGAARIFSDALGSGEVGWAPVGGVVLRLRDHLALAADVGSLQRDGEWPGSGVVWGAGLQLRIPTTPHSLSLQATNTRTATLQGSSGSAVPRRTVWGFEFTVPVTLARYLPGLRGTDGGAAAGEPDPTDAGPERPAGTAPDTVRVTMTEDLRFAPDTVRVPEGATVVWENTTELVHTVTADPEAVRDPAQVALPEGAEPFDSGNMFEGDVFRHTFSTPGEYNYVCVPHDLVDMVGTVIVEPAGGP